MAVTAELEKAIGMNKKRNDKIFILSVIILSIFILIWLYISREPGGTVIVYVNGNPYGEYALSVDQTVPVYQEDGRYNILVINEGQADITEASCPDHLCVHQKSIHYTGESIICLPHQVVIEVNKATGRGLDGVAH